MSAIRNQSYWKRTLMLSPWCTRRMAWMYVSFGASKYRTYKTHLAENVADLQDLELGATAQVINLVHTVGHNNPVKGARVDALNSVTAQNAVRDQCVNLGCALLFQQLGGTGDRVRSIREVVNQNGYPIANITNQHHGSVLAVCDLSGAALLQKALD